MADDGIEVLDLDSLSFGWSPRREGHDASHVAALAEVLERVPPIVVHAASLRVVDGVHRVLAARARGWRAIAARMLEGDETVVAIEAIRSNVGHGKPLTVEERQAAAARLIALLPGWSDRRLAVTCGVSAKTIVRLRRRLATGDSGVRIGRDERARPLDPNERRRRVVAVLDADPDASIRAVAAASGASHGTVRDVKDRLSRGDSAYVGTYPRGGGIDLSSAAETPLADRDQPTLTDDPAFASTAEVERVATWVESRRTEDADWAGFVEIVPVGRVYEVADTVRASGESMLAFATKLEERVRARSSNPQRR